MKIREIILDFTSLLDVMMIILFFFILFSKVDVETATERANKAESSYNSMLEETERIKLENQQEQEEWREKASEEWERIGKADENAAKNQEALSAYNEGKGIAFNLHDVEKGDVWTLSVLCGSKKLGEISSEDKRNIREMLKDMIKKAGYSYDDVVIATLTFNGDEYGTETAVPTVENSIIGIQREYKNLYFTTINTTK
ncbi:MAG: biopolymer transporter ExbD [Ruminococcus sp.]|uniref:biopolymer transporter ExbD n=1 Tax=Ruminococcus sp. TaxID=41978 RepID=UPI0025E11459|nr:biopolymer transporter ExbD [Ruminococcus sp.]MCR5600339.1 biopolymer transporter ExbD [Ruminococcus sp.]